MIEHVDREELARAAMPLVGHCVASVAARVPRHVRQDELVSAGFLGLAQAARSWDPERGVSFDHYARQRINGALLDELRGRDWASRSARADGRRIRGATDDLTNRLGRAPGDDEIAAELGVDVDDVRRIRDDVERSVVLHLEAIAPEGDGVQALSVDRTSDPVHAVLGNELRGYLHDAVLALPERLRTILVGYYFEERPMQEIADELGVTVSRVSQLRAEAVRLMREGLDAQFAEGDVDEVSAPPRGRSERKRAEYVAAIARASTPAARVSSSAAGLQERLVAAG